MNRLSVSLHSIQHISSLSLEIDLSNPGLSCLVGRNGTGKTTLVRALRNLSNADTFVKSTDPSIFNEESRIIYNIDGKEITFKYDASLGSLNCHQEIPKSIREGISAELPIPHGARFNYFRTASSADDEIRKRTVLGTATKPQELINFLTAIYENDKYNALIEVTVKGKSYYAIANPDGTYIREDYLSSGEYFLLNLYRTIKSATKLVVIDEIDLSLDAAAQAKLTGWLRSFCKEYGCKILFTTHSLAIMRTLDASEIVYMDLSNSKVTFTPASYSYVKARLFGFRGWDKYILTEDAVLMGFIEYLLANSCRGIFFNYKIIHIGGGSQVADLLSRNASDEFLARQSDVIAVIDGDQRGQPHASNSGVYLIPIDSVEKDLYKQRVDDTDFPFHVDRTGFTGDKDFFRYLQQTGVANITQIYAYLAKRNAERLEPLIGALSEFLARPVSSSPKP